MINTEEQSRIKKIWKDNKINSRKSYRVFKKENPNSNLPSSRSIEKEFGSFSSFKNFMDFNSIAKEENEKFTVIQICIPESISENAPEEKTLLESLISIFNKFKISNRDQYRKAKKENPDLEIPSTHQICKEFYSFSNLKSVIDAKTKERENFNPNEVEDNKIIAPNKSISFDDEIIKDWKDAVKEKRKEIFGGGRVPYRWDPKSRAKISNLSYFFRA